MSFVAFNMFNMFYKVKNGLLLTLGEGEHQVMMPQTLWTLPKT